MEKTIVHIAPNKIPNKDIIITVYIDGKRPRYKEVYIEKKNSLLLQELERCKKDLDFCFIEMQEKFSSAYFGVPKSYSYCYPNSYDKAYISRAEYPKLYTEEEYNEVLEKVKEDYIKEEIGKLNRRKEDSIIKTEDYENEIIEINNNAEIKKQEKNRDIKYNFIDKALRYIYAEDFYRALDKIKSNQNNIIYSSDSIGWTIFNYTVNDVLKIIIKTNFCYGRSTYFKVTFVYKDVEILFYEGHVIYYYANMVDLIDCTRPFKEERESWKRALFFIVQQANFALDDEDAFVDKWIIKGAKKLLFGLKRILYHPKEVVEEFIKKFNNNKPFHILRNILKDEIIEYRLHEKDVIVVFQAEKISKSLLFLQNLQKLSELYPQIKDIIKGIEDINKLFIPNLHAYIFHFLKEKSKQEKMVECVKNKYNVFLQEYRNIIKDPNNSKYKDIIEQKSVLERKILEEEIEFQRIKQIYTNLSLCMQLICDYGLNDANGVRDVVTQVTHFQDKLAIDFDSMRISKNGKRLFLNNKYPHVEIPKTIKVICDSAFSKSNYYRVESIIFPEGLLFVGDCVFQNCFNLKEIILPNSVQKIGTDCFYNCRALEKIIISSSMNEIPPYSFNQCTSLKQIEIPDSIKNICNGAFKDCKALTSIRLPKYLDFVGDDVFVGCDKLETIYVPHTLKKEVQKSLSDYTAKFKHY